jgi:hypothetical protein
VCTGGDSGTGGGDSGLPTACQNITCIAPDDCVYLEVAIALGGPSCNFTMCSYATGHGVCQ